MSKDIENWKSKFLHGSAFSKWDKNQVRPVVTNMQVANEGHKIAGDPQDIAFGYRWTKVAERGIKKERKSNKMKY